MTRLPLLHSPRLCRRGGDVCGDYVDDGRGGCRYFATTVATDAEGDFAVPACALAMADEGPQFDGEVGAALGVSRERARQYGMTAEDHFRRRAKFAGLRDLLDLDEYADKRAAVVPEDDDDDQHPQMPSDGNRARVLAAVRRGLERPVDIANATGLVPRYVSSNLSRLAKQRLVVRVGAAQWVAASPVQYAKESA